MDEDKFAAAFPKSLWMPSRDVARIGVEALEHDLGIVIAGKRNVFSTRLLQALPRPLLLSMLSKQHPGLRPDCSSRTRYLIAPHVRDT